jgi:hypothetical protein
VTGHGPLTSASASAIAEYLITRLLGKGFLPALMMVTEKLAYFQIYFHTVSQYGKVLDNPHITAVHFTAFMTTVGTNAFFRRRRGIHMKNSIRLLNILNLKS